MSARLIAIGDIHGCSKALRALVEAIQPAADDTLVLLGDYVDRGPDSRGVLDFLLELESRCKLIPLLGNHELMLLDALQHADAIAPWAECGGYATLQSYGGRLTNIPREHLAFIGRCQRYAETPLNFFVHANYDADIPLSEQPDYLLFWEHLHFHLPLPHENGKIAIVGHTAQRTFEVLNLGHIICLDTCCHAGGWLTAMEAETGQLWQADRSGRLRTQAQS
jgi:serine/threonine protein phosphatase 1